MLEEKDEIVFLLGTVELFRVRRLTREKKFFKIMLRKVTRFIERDKSIEKGKIK